MAISHSVSGEVVAYAARTRNCNVAVLLPFKYIR
jgi:hypothetical protein